jgi:integral membrane protein (TIGR00529 family)
MVNVLVLFKLLGIFAFVILLLRLGWNAGLVLVLASVVTSLLFCLPFRDYLLEALGAAVAPLTLQLLAIVLLITFLGVVLRSTLQMEGMVRSLGDLVVDRRCLLALLPMIIGMLPMVGGAMFSAPMVQEASQGLNLSNERKTFINYWFRHSLESIFPLYPSLVLAAGLMGVTPQTLTRTQWPLFLATLAGGAFFGLVGVGRAGLAGDDSRGRRESLLLLAKSIWPILLVLSLALALGVDLILSLLLTLALLAIVYRLGPRQLWPLMRAVPLATVPIIVGTMVFRRTLEVSGAVEATSSTFTTLGIPSFLIVFTIPLLAGLLTGLTLPAFAIGFPIVLPLCGPDLIASGCGLLAYAGGLVGLLLSPVHLCLTLTRAYFQAEWGGLYRRILPAALLMIAAAAAVVLVK